ncbi:MAG: tryptophan-rich sensory protein [Coriobacteriia bacterium]|nr:tryptophan-rich sensory protein [Coriobacteriia bacterium]
MTAFRTWYDALVKPSWTPAPETIGTIWTIIYPLIAVAVVGTVAKVLKGDLPRIVLVPLVVNVVANIAFTPIQFGLRNLPLASADILIILATIVWWMVLVWKPGSQWIAAPLAPYLVWVSLATVLQLSITFANRG